MAFKPIQILINAKDDASAVFDKLQNKIAAVGAAILGYFGVRAFVGVVSGAADLEAALSRVKAATGASADEMKLLRKTAEEAGATSRYSAVEAAGALENLAKAGLSAKDAIGTLPAVLNLAAAGDVELAVSAEYITKAVNGLGLSFTDAARVSDVLAKGANATNTSVAGLAQALSYAAPLANTLGLSLEQTVAIIGKFADAGIDASRAGTALNSIMAQFSDPASKFRTELAAAGITTVNFNEALHEIAKGGPGAERAINALGTEAGPAFRALVNQGIGKLDELVKGLNDAEGSAAATAKVMQDNLKDAVKGLGRAWETVTNALGTPVLPILQRAVEQLAGSLRGAVNDGTVAKFGTAIAGAFQAGITWAKNFIANFDLDGLIAKLNAFSAQAQQTFDDVGKKAETAGNVVKLAYGVMAGGVNVVLTAVYGIGSTFAEVGASVLNGIASIQEKAAKVTFGEISKRYSEAAAEAREAAGGFNAAADAMGVKAAASFAAAADAAETARAGYRGLSTDSSAAAEGAAKSAAAIAAVATQLQATAEANAVAADKSRQAAAQLVEQAAAAEKARATQEALRAEYSKAIATGNVQRAAEVMVQLRQATDAAAAAAEKNTRKQQEQAKAIEAAFARVGVVTKQQLRDAAEVARQDFETIRDSGQASADAIAAAWAKSAQAAIDANEGVVPYWVQGQAESKGYTVQVDAAGKATLQLAQTSAALKGLVTGFNNAAGAAAGYGQAVAGIPAPGQGGGRPGAPGASFGGGVPGGGGGGHGGGQIGFVDSNGNFIPTGNDNRGKPPAVIGPNQQVKSNLGDTREDKLVGQNAVDNRLMFLLRDKLNAGTLTPQDVGDLQAVIASLKQNALQNAQVDRHGASQISLEGRRDDLAWQNTMRAFQDEVERLTGGAISAGGATYVTNIKLDGGGSKKLNFADRESQDAASDLLRDLARGRSVARR